MQTPYCIFGPTMGMWFVIISENQIIPVHVWILFDDPRSTINSRQIAHNNILLDAACLWLGNKIPNTRMVFTSLRIGMFLSSKRVFNHEIT